MRANKKKNPETNATAVFMIYSLRKTNNGVKNERDEAEVSGGSSRLMRASR